MKIHIWIAENDNEDMIDHRCYVHNLISCEIKALKKFKPKWDSNPRPEMRMRSL